MASPRGASHTIDPGQIQDPSQIPPSGAQFAGKSAKGLVDVYNGTVSGDIDAQPAAKELLGTAVDTGGLSNADYIYSQVSALYGGVDLPSFQSPSGNSVRALVFVSGSSGGGYGAFHIEGTTQSDFDRIAVDSLNASGNYSAGSGLGSALAPIRVKADRLLAPHRGPSDLLGVIHADDPRLHAAKPKAIEEALNFAAQSIDALKMALETRDTSAVPRSVRGPLQDSDAARPARRLVHANQNILGLTAAVAAAGAGRQYLSTALVAAEIIESFQLLTGKANAGKTDGEAVSRVVAFKLSPEIALVPGFNSGVTQQWWTDGHQDFVNDNSQTDQSTDGNGAGVMFLLFLNDYLGVPFDRILAAMPATNGAPLGKTYEALLAGDATLADKGGRDGIAAFQNMISLLTQNSQRADQSLNLPADGNPFPSMPNSQQGGLFAAAKPVAPGSIAQDAQAALGLESQIEQQLAALKATLALIPGDISGSPAPAVVHARGEIAAKVAASKAGGPYGPNLPSALAASLEQQAAPFLAPQFDQSLQHDFWQHVYNELPGSGTHTDRLEVITGTNQVPRAVQITGTITSTAPQKDGDLHMTFQPDSVDFPTNHDSAEAPLEVEIIYAGPIHQADAQQAAQGYTNPFATKPLGTGVRIQVAGPLIFDRAHGRPTPDGKNVGYGLELHPVVALTLLGPAPPPPAPPNGGHLAADLTSALNQAESLSQTVGNLTALIRGMQGETPSHA